MSNLNDSDYVIDERIYAMPVSELLHLIDVKMLELQNIVASKGMTENLTQSQIFEFQARKEELRIAEKLIFQKNSQLVPFPLNPHTQPTIMGVVMDDFLKELSAAYLPPPPPLTDAQIQKAAKFAYELTKHPMFGKFPDICHRCGQEEVACNCSSGFWSEREWNRPKKVEQVADQGSKPKTKRDRKIVFDDA